MDSSRHERLLALDRAHVWHPFTQMAVWPSDEPLIIERAEGNELIDDLGRRYLDGVSSLWCNVHGHRKREIDDAVRAQLDRVAHSHAARPRLGALHRAGRGAGAHRARRADPRLLLGLGQHRGRGRAEDGLPVLAAARPAGEDALRRARRGLPRRHRGLGLGRRHGALPRHLPRPALRRRAAAEPEPVPLDRRRRPARRRAARGGAPAEREGLDARGAGPRAAGAGRGGDVDAPARVPARRWPSCAGSTTCCSSATRWPPASAAPGRCSPWSRRASARTSSASPRASPAATCRSPRPSPPTRVYEAFLGEFAAARTFFHGHTYTGNPLACAAALASLAAVRDGAVLERVRRTAEVLRPKLAAIAELPHVGDVRQRGLMVGIELVARPAHAGSPTTTPSASGTASASRFASAASCSGRSGRWW